MSLTSFLAKKQKTANESWKNHFEIVEKTSSSWILKCKFCNHQFNGRWQRAKAHLLGQSGEGVKACKAVPDSVRIAILEECSVSSTSVSLVQTEQEPDRKMQPKMGAYLAKSIVSAAAIQLIAKKANAVSWWMESGSGVPHVQYVAVHILSLA